MKFFRGDLFQREKTTRTPFLIEFHPFRAFSIGTDSIPTDSYYVLESLRITVLIVRPRLFLTII